jgi:hypothetical protein
MIIRLAGLSSCADFPETAASLAGSPMFGRPSHAGRDGLPRGGARVALAGGNLLCHLRQRSRARRDTARPSVAATRSKQIVLRHESPLSRSAPARQLVAEKPADAEATRRGLHSCREHCRRRSVRSAGSARPDGRHVLSPGIGSSSPSQRALGQRRLRKQRIR